MGNKNHSEICIIGAGNSGLPPGALLTKLGLIGDCVKAPGIRINCAINSARVLQEMFTGSI